LLAAGAQLGRHQEKTKATIAQAEWKANFKFAKPLESLGLAPREAEELVWIAQGKACAEVATVLGCAGNTIKVHPARFLNSWRLRTATLPRCGHWKSRSHPRCALDRPDDDQMQAG